jgi:hypothetical protein
MKPPSNTGDGVIKMLLLSAVLPDAADRRTKFILTHHTLYASQPWETL